MSLTSVRRRGFTLVELTVVIVLLGIIGTSIMRTILRQQRFYRSTTEIMDARSQLRQAMALLPIDLRGASAPGGDIIAVAENSITFRATIGASVICSGASGNTTIHLPPTGLASGVVLTSFASTPTTSDSVAIYNETSDSWTRLGISTAPTTAGANCPVASGLRTAADAAGYTMVLSAGLPAGVATIGAPIRFLRRVNYQLYQASDSKWYLGYAANGAAVQPVAGPYRAYSAGSATSGMTVTCFDSTGSALTTAQCSQTTNGVSRIDITMRAETEHAVSTGGGSGTNAQLTDQTLIRVGLRNRR